LNNEQFDIQLRIIKVDQKNSELADLLRECRDISTEILISGNRQQLTSVFDIQREAADYFVVAQEIKAGQVVGSMALKNLDPGELFISATVVRLQFQGRGISQEMMKYLEKHSSEYVEFSSHVTAGNPQSTKSRIAMGFNIDPTWQDADGCLRFFKPVDQKKAEKTFQEAETEIRVIFPKKKSMQNLNNKAPNNQTVGGNLV